jgi:hypothetical protein
MTLEKLQYPARSRTTRLCARTAAALACGLFVFSTPNYSQTIAATERTVVAVTSAERPTLPGPEHGAAVATGVRLHYDSNRTRVA